MTIDKAKILLCQMYLPQFDEDEKQALSMAIKALEEIEEYRLKEFQCHLAQQEGITIGYNKAIDEFAETLKEEYVFEGICRDDISKYEYENKIDRMVKQLKAGV